jgi:hypothetical protein
MRTIEEIQKEIGLLSPCRPSPEVYYLWRISLHVELLVALMCEQRAKDGK